MQNFRLFNAFNQVAALSPSMRAEVAKMIKASATAEEWASVNEAGSCPPGAKKAHGRAQRDRRRAEVARVNSEAKKKAKP